MGVYSTNSYFYKPVFGANGEVEMGKFHDALDVADAEIKANKNAKHTQGTDQGLDAGGANAVVVADVKDAVTKKHTQGTDTGLGAMAANINMDTHKLTSLSVPASNGDSIRATTKITEANLEDAIDKKHTQNTDTDLDSTFEATFGKHTDKLNAFAATTSAELAGVISDETGTDKLVYNTSPVLVTPTLGIATATSINTVYTKKASLSLANGVNATFQLPTEGISTITQIMVGGTLVGVTFYSGFWIFAFGGYGMNAISGITGFTVTISDSGLVTFTNVSMGATFNFTYIITS